MTSILKNEKQLKRLEWGLDALSLMAVLQYCIYRFLQSTMFNFYYSQTYKMITLLLLLAFGGMRYLYVVITKLKRCKEKRERVQFFLRCGGAWILAVPFLYVGWLHDYKFLIFIPICAMCLYDMMPEKVCRAFAVTVGICLAATMLCCLSGTVQNIVDSEKYLFSSYGIINTTDFASYCSFLLLLIWCGMRIHRWQASLMFAFFSLSVTYGVFILTNSRTTLVTGGLLFFFILWNCLEDSSIHNAKWFRYFAGIIKWFSILAFPIVGLFVVYVTVQYGAQSPWATQLNTALSGRLHTVLSPYRAYGIGAFGNSIEKMHGQGGTILGQFWSSGYGYMDVAYAMLAIRYGWVITAVVTGLWTWMSAKAYKNGRKRFAYALAIMAVHAISEARILDVNYNILLVMPFCSFFTKNETIENVKVNEKRIFKPLIAGAVVLGIASYLLPESVSWMRTFFSLKGWNSGTAAFNSFIVCACGIIALWLLWKTASSFWESKKKELLAALLGIIVVIAGGVSAVNKTIEQGRAEQADRLAADEQVIKTIQKAAAMPIYASDSSELYRRDGIKLADHLFPVNELGRYKGTILVDNSVEALSIILSGGLYTQISEQTGLYTYDYSVVEALEQAGFELTRSYSGIQHADLRDVALFNDIKMKDGLRIESRKITTASDENDQLFGNYQVRFAFSGLTTATEGDVVLLEVIGEHGERTLVQEALSTDDFDSDGCCTYILHYQIRPTPGVSYAVSALEGVSVNIDDISWQRIVSKENEDLLHSTIQIGQYESSGVSYIGNADGTLTVKGEATGTSFYNIYINENEFPYWLQRGKEYLIQINDPEEMVSFELYLYDADKNIIFPALVSTKTSQVFSLPDDACGIILRFRAWEGKQIDTTVMPLICENE